MTGQTQGERMAAVETWIEGHEERCEERLAGIGRELRDIKTAQGETRTDLKGMQKAAWGMVIALAAWLLLQVYDGLKPVPAAAPSTMVSVNPAPASPAATARP